MVEFSSSFLNFDFNSIDEYLASVKEFDLDAIQNSEGIYTNSHQIVNLPKLQIGLRSMNCATIHNGVLLQDAYYIVIPKDNCDTYINGKQVGLAQFFIVKPGEEVSTLFPQNFSAAIICIPVSSLADCVDENSLMLLHKSYELLRLDYLGTPKFNNLNKKLTTIVNFTVKNYHILSQQSLVDAQESILLTLTQLLFPILDGMNSIKIKKCNHYEIVKLSLLYLKAKDNHIISIPELAKVCGCSIRNLEYAFKSILQITPKQFLIKRRLNMIHKLFCQKNNIMIKDVASSFGIVNVGRFSQDYYKMFGCYPSETLAKTKLPS